MTTWTAPTTLEGWAEPSASASNVPSSTGGQTWSSPANIRAGQPWENQTTALGSTTPTAFLNARTFGLAIPASATILGVEVEFEFGSTQSTVRVDTDVRLSFTATGSTLSTANRAMGLTLPVLGTRVYGGPSDLWGEALTPALLNSADFGVVFRLGVGTGGTASVRSIRVRVTYSVVEDGAARVTQVRSDALIALPGAVRVTTQHLNVLSKSQGFARITAARIEVIRSLANGVVDVTRRRRQIFIVGD